MTIVVLAAGHEAETATITAHSLRDVRSILDANDLHRDTALGENAIRKMEAAGENKKAQKSPNWAAESNCVNGENPGKSIG